MAVQSQAGKAVNNSVIDKILFKDKLLKRKLNIVFGNLLLYVSDVATLIFATGLAFATRKFVFPYILPSLYSQDIAMDFLTLFFPMLLLLQFSYEGLYHKRYPYWQEVKLIVKGNLWSLGIGVAILFVLKISTDVSRTLLVLISLYSILLMPISRLYFKRYLIRNGIWQKSMILIGNGKIADLVVDGFLREDTFGYKVVGWIKAGEQVEGSNNNVTLLGDLQDIKTIIEQIGVRDVIIAIKGMDNKELIKLTSRIQKVTSNVMLVPDLLGIPLIDTKLEYLFNERTLMLSIKNNLSSSWNKFLKRTFDLVVGIIIFVLILPIMLIVSLLIKKEDPKGSAIFMQPRLGLNDKDFMCYKFRTMFLDNDKLLEDYLNKNPKAKEEWIKFAKLKDYDPRVTKIGRIIRKYSLDELPQIINVLKGEMSGGVGKEIPYIVVWNYKNTIYSVL